MTVFSKLLVMGVVRATAELSENVLDTCAILVYAVMCSVLIVATYAVRVLQYRFANLPCKALLWLRACRSDSFCTVSIHIITVSALPFLSSTHNVRSELQIFDLTIGSFVNLVFFLSSWICVKLAFPRVQYVLFPR